MGVSLDVAPPAGAWIETSISQNLHLLNTSRLPQARGLKRFTLRCAVLSQYVAPPAGAWIETKNIDGYAMDGDVAPPAGAWIETTPRTRTNKKPGVAPPAGAWIETR